MKIIDILKQSAELLGLQQEKDILNTATAENQEEILKNEEINRLLNLSALSIQELCSNYISVCERLNVKVEDLTYSLNNLKNYVRIIGVTKNEIAVKYKIYNRNIVFEENGEYTIEYCSYPDITSLFDEIDFLKNFSPDVIVMGICAYYAVAQGMFNEFNTFHEQYIEKANAIKELKMFELPLRRWE